MLKRGMKAGASGLAGMCLLLAMSQSLHAQMATAVPTLDLNRFTGTWHEVARYPFKREKKCVSDLVTLIALGDKANRIQVVSSCKTKTGYSDVRNANGKKQDKSGSGKLKISYTWPFSTKYWVLALGPDYEWALVGSPNHKNLWVYSRTPVLAPEVLAEVESKAAAQGFPQARMVAQQAAAH